MTEQLDQSIWSQSQQLTEYLDKKEREKQALIHAGRIADISLRLVGGRGLNGYIIAAKIDDFTKIISELIPEVFLYSCFKPLKSDEKIFCLANTMVECVRNLCYDSIPFIKTSFLAKELRAATEAYNDYIIQMNEATES